MQNDLSLSLSVNPFSGDLSLVREENAIKQALYTLIKTSVYEKPFVPLFGNRLTKSLFELYDDSLVSQIREDLTTLIKNFDDRVSIINISVTNENNELEIILIYYTQTSTAPQKLEISLKRTF